MKCTQHLGDTDDSTFGVKMFFRVVILVFAATCCRARVIGKSLYTRKYTLGRQQICNRWRREASCQFLGTDTSHRLTLHLGAVEGLMFKCQR